MKKVASAVRAVGILLAPLSVTVAVVGLVLSVPVRGEAQPQLEQSLSAEQRATLEEAKRLNQQVERLYGEGKYTQAIPLAERALAITEKALGKEHPAVATILNNLAEVYSNQGLYQKVEPLYTRALAIREKALGKEHPAVATILNNLARLYHSQGSYQKAEPLYTRALAIREKALGKEHPIVATSLNSLALLYSNQGLYQKAEPLYTRALAIREKALGKEHPDVAQGLNNLALLYSNQGLYQKAKPLYTRALAITEKALGKEHPIVATILNNLALLYHSQGLYQKAEPLYTRALAIREKALGKEHPRVVTSLNNLAALYRAQGDIARATDFLRRGLEVQEHNLTLINAVGSEQRKQAYVSTFTGTTYGIISLSLQEARNNPVVAQLALTTALRRKGRVLDAVADSVQILRSQLQNPQTKKFFDEWLSVQQQLSALVYAQQGKQTPQEYKTRFEQLEESRDRLEAAISSISAEFRSETQPVELAAIQAKIPLHAVLVEIVQYEPFNVKAKKPSEKWGKPRYAAALLRSTGEPKWIDLGDAATINKSITAFREVITSQILPPQEQARHLDEQIMAPIRKLLGNARQILLSPDGQLTLIPFEALQDEKGQYLIQNYSISYLTSGRDLLRFPSQEKSGSAPVVLADIDYDNFETRQVASGQKNTTRAVVNRRSDEFGSLVFGSLAGTKAEAAAVQKILTNAKLLLGKQATETAVKQLRAPSILHLATHGFFLTDQEFNSNPSLTETGQPQPTFSGENPLLRAGLAFAGVNKRNQTNAGNDDGVLTALEVAGLNLHGTQLAVLSACDTGVGNVTVGEGVYGLRRALVIAGSQSQIFSLWSVDDIATKDLMVKYYQKLKAGKGRHQALREAQLEVLKTPGYEHPYFWAAFVPSGDWGVLHK